MAVSPAFTIVPTVIVYPLASSPPLDHDTSAKIVTTLQNQIARGGNVRVVSGGDGVARENYLADARKVGRQLLRDRLPHADRRRRFGRAAGRAAHVRHTGLQRDELHHRAWPTSPAQGDQLRVGILERSTRGIQAFEAPPPPESTPTPKPSNGADVDVNKLFSPQERTGRRLGRAGTARERDARASWQSADRPTSDQRTASARPRSPARSNTPAVTR